MLLAAWPFKLATIAHVPPEINFMKSNNLNKCPVCGNHLPLYKKIFFDRRTGISCGDCQSVLKLKFDVRTLLIEWISLFVFVLSIFQIVRNETILVWCGIAIVAAMVLIRMPQKTPFRIIHNTLKETSDSQSTAQ